MFRENDGLQVPGHHLQLLRCFLFLWPETIKSIGSMFQDANHKYVWIGFDWILRFLLVTPLLLVT